MYGRLIINLRERVAAQFILQPQQIVKELLQMHFNVMVMKLVLLMQACAQQLNDPTGAPFYNLLYIPWTLVYNFKNSIGTMACVWLPSENRTKIHQCYVTGKSQGCLPVCILWCFWRFCNNNHALPSLMLLNESHSVFIFPLATYRENWSHDILQPR